MIYLGFSTARNLSARYAATTARTAAAQDALPSFPKPLQAIHALCGSSGQLPGIASPRDRWCLLTELQDAD